MDRSKHVGKSLREKGAYTGRLARIEPSPTAEVEEQLPPPESDVSEEGRLSPKTSTRRRVGLEESLRRHFRQYWASWLITLVVGLLLFFLTDVSGTLGRIEGILDGIGKQLNTHESRIGDIEDEVHDQELKLQEQGMKIEYMEKDLQETAPKPTNGPAEKPK